MNIYENYKYNRHKPRRKHFLFLALVIIIGIAITTVICSIFFGVKKNVNTQIELPALEFNAVGVRGLGTKSKALELAREIREQGGAGFVDFDEEWFVLEEIGRGDLRFSAEAITVNLAKKEHKKTLEIMIESYAKNTEILQSLLGKPPIEAAAEALNLYNDLKALVSELETTNSVAYSEISVAVNKHLLALFLLSTEKNPSTNSAIKHCICWINFAYIELLTSLHSQ